MLLWWGQITGKSPKSPVYSVLPVLVLMVFIVANVSSAEILFLCTTSAGFQLVSISKFRALSGIDTRKDRVWVVQAVRREPKYVVYQSIKNTRTIKILGIQSINNTQPIKIRNIFKYQ